MFLRHQNIKFILSLHIKCVFSDEGNNFRKRCLITRSTRILRDTFWYPCNNDFFNIIQVWIYSFDIGSICWRSSMFLIEKNIFQRKRIIFILQRYKAYLRVFNIGLKSLNLFCDTTIIIKKDYYIWLKFTLYNNLLSIYV